MPPVATAPAALPGLPWPRGLAYAGLAVPLAFVSLPLYVNLPYHYATAFGMPLAALGGVVLAVRALDAVIDPALGRLADGLFNRGRAWAAAALGALLMALAFAALWWPPQGGPAVVLPWLAGALLLCTLAYSGVSILHQSWGTRWGGGPELRARVAGWREAGTLAGVLFASALPALAGWSVTSAVLAGLLLLGLLGLRRVPAPQPAAEDGAVAATPWRQPAFRRLAVVFMLNGIATAIPATLLPFFIADRLQAPDLQPVLLLAYFGAAVLGLPLWVKAGARWGLAPAWRAGMLAAVAAFAVTPLLGAGDAWAFGFVCAASGLMLGADLALPGALLTGVIQAAGDGQRGEGRYLGWWACMTKLNLALAAGLALPLLALAGYTPGRQDDAGLQALTWAYGGLPCLLKIAAATWLWRAERWHTDWKDRE
ncbi:MFS transporter [Roseateles sp. LKC17W]|uniref:MFS transporter n=1 Tax=Pelomonas margarita TaxID=3299031 RepID=A0ABW7FPS3_9BURK